MVILFNVPAVPTNGCLAALNFIALVEVFI